MSWEYWLFSKSVGLLGLGHICPRRHWKLCSILELAVAMLTTETIICDCWFCANDAPPPWCQYLVDSGVTDLQVANSTCGKLHNCLIPRQCTFLSHRQWSADSLKRCEFSSREQLLILLDVPGQKSVTTPTRQRRNWIWNISVADPWDCVSTRRLATCTLRMLTWASWKLVLTGAWLSLWWQSLMASHLSSATTLILMTTVTCISQTAAPSTSAGGILYCPLPCPIAKESPLASPMVQGMTIAQEYSPLGFLSSWGFELYFEVKVPWSQIWG